ncbi:MAG: CAP domain-containing protein [Bacillota bacterium]|nr:CAP domain-containing protein [Bacillota bacterium]HHU62568.1 sporulation protein [Natronincola sp.]
MKRSIIVAFIILVIATPIVSASSWDWWSSNPPSLKDPGWQNPNPLPPIDPNPLPPVNPDPAPNPNPNPTPPPVNPGGPLLPSQPSNPSNKVPVPSRALSAEESRLIEQVNQERTQAGLRPLQVDQGLVSLAKDKSYDMIVNNYFSHTSPTLGTVYAMLDRAGIRYNRAGENIAKTGSFERVHPLFMGSSGHRANIMHGDYTHIGVGIVTYGPNYHVTQIFIKR